MFNHGKGIPEVNYTGKHFWAGVTLSRAIPFENVKDAKRYIMRESSKDGEMYTIWRCRQLYGRYTYDHELHKLVGGRIQK